MKKAITLMLAVLMILSMATIAMAAAPGDSEDIDVTAKYNSSISTVTVYSVDIVWEDMTFTYNEETEKVWNAADHSYTSTTTGDWDKTTATITVTNHSNAAVTANVAYTPVTNTGVTGTLNTTEKTLAAGAEGKPDEADALVATLTISGKPNENVTNAGVKIGSITVTLS